ncbi:MAG TPA: zf-HC2 domain-containing protein [Gemmatimonadaceae bacterium]|nr:zf-HC2 domain-containing protein [Gemmatimonadaceae bacterium]
MNCDAFDERLSEYLEGEVPPRDRRALEAHVASCLRCAALVRDLEGIRAAASMLPELTPARDLWDGIAERIDTPVMPLVPRSPVVVRPSASRRSFDRLRLAAIAAGLVAVTAGITYTLTVASSRSGDPSSQVATVARPDSQERSDSVEASRAVAPTTPREVAAADSGPEPARRQAEPVQAPTQLVRNAPATPSQSREIDRLRAVFAQTRHQLDPRTAAIIEANLKVIDEAIAQSKAALEQDPASRFLTEQLNSALDKKLELLRTAARLPQRTS